MKKVLTLLIFIIVSLSKNENISAQTDSIKVEYKQESSDSSDYSVRSKYNYLNINLKEEKNILKLGFKPFTIMSGTSYQFTTNLIFEKKILPEWSIISEFGLGFENEKKDIFDWQNKNKSYKLNLGARYYYGMKKAIRKGNSANNFNSNYFELSAMNIPPFSRVTKRYHFLTNDPSNPVRSSTITTNYKTALQFSWGIQRRLNNYTFIDTKLLVGYYLNDKKIYGEHWFVGLDIIVGFGYNVKRK